ncbi:MAG: class I lanthipeptide [Bacteroidia bacterium]
MTNSKLILNKATIANLSTEEMIDVTGGAATYDSSRRRCCESCCDGEGQSSDVKCCDCPDAAVGTANG